MKRNVFLVLILIIPLTFFAHKKLNKTEEKVQKYLTLDKLKNFVDEEIKKHGNLMIDDEIDVSKYVKELNEADKKWNTTILSVDEVKGKFYS